MKVTAVFCSNTNNADMPAIELIPQESMRDNMDTLYRAASILDRSAISLDIFGPSYWWLVAETDQGKPLSAWLTGKETEDVTVIVCARRRSPPPASSSAVDSLFAKERFQTSLVWQPCNMPDQTPFGVSQFLGALFMIDAACNIVEQARLAAYVASCVPSATQRLPFLYSLYAFWIEKERPSFAMQAVIASGLFAVFSARIQKQTQEKEARASTVQKQPFDATKVFEHSLELWTELQKEANALSEEEQKVLKTLFLESVWLTCALTHARLENPVRTMAIAAATGESVSSNSSTVTAVFTAPTAEATATADSLEKKGKDVPENEKEKKRVYSALAVVARQPGGKMFLPGNPFANCKVVPDVEYAAYLLAQPNGTVLCRLNTETARSVFDNMAQKTGSITVSPLSAPSEATKQQQQKKLFKIQHPLALRNLDPPCLTWLAPKTVGVYEAQGKGSQTDVHIFNFATSSCEAHDPDDLADKIDIGQFQEGDAEGGGGGATLPLGEAVIVLLDVSGSMSSAFTKEPKEKEEEEKEEEERKEDTDDVVDLAPDPKDEAVLARIAASDWPIVARRLFNSQYVTRLLRIVAIAEPNLADLIRRRPQTLKKLILEATAEKKQQEEKQKSMSSVASTSSEEKKIGINIKNMTGQTMSLQVYASDRIATIKERVAEEWSLDSLSFRIIFAGTSLKDESLVKENNITEGVLLHATVYATASKRPLASSVKDGRRTIQIRYGPVKNSRSMGSIVVDGSESMAKLYLLACEAGRSTGLNGLETYCLWYNMKDIGDSYQSGSTLFGAKVDMLRLDCDDILFIGSVPRSHPSRTVEAEKKKHREKNRLDRITVAKHLFETFCDRLRSYRLPTHLGLIKFGSTVDYACPLAAAFRRFRRTSDEAKAQGDTHLYDALVTACDRLVEYRDERNKAGGSSGNNVSLRIVVLSDGKDEGSSLSALDAARRLWSNGVICDAIQIGKASDTSQELSAIARCTGGYTFVPQTANESVYPFELETMLSSEQRVLNRSASMPSNWDISYSSVQRQSCSRDSGVPPPRKLPAALSLSAQTIEAALTRDVDAAIGDAIRGAEISTTTSANAPAVASVGRDTLRQLMIQLRLLNDTPHPQIDVYPCESNLLVWRFVVSVPADTENTPYAGGTFLLYALFPAEFPRTAPEIRFITPIRHVNVNMYGRICHSILSENWNASRTMSEVLSCVYGLLLCADVESPIDSALAQQYHVDAGVYEATIADHVRAHARSATRVDYRRRLVRENRLDDDDDKKTIAERVRTRSRAATRANLCRNEGEEDDLFPASKKHKKEDSKKHISQEKEDMYCVVCLAERRGVLLLPCAHAVLCNTCGNAWRELCPICRKAVTSTQRIFLS